MTDKCRRRMNGKEEYITTEITQSKGGRPKRGGRPRERKEAPGVREELEIPILERGVPSPWDVGLSDSVCFLPPKQVVASSQHNFWTHSLQIYYDGPDLKTETLQLAPSVGKLLVR